ncbi:MAG: pyruvate carboxylase, partial [Pseudomonadota bacterium]
LVKIREGAPNLLLQALVRGSNGVGYTGYPDNTVRRFIHEAAKGGVDLFRVFDCLNWVENMRVSIDAVIESGKLCEGTICYTGDVLAPKNGQKRNKYDLDYYLAMARELEAAGCHIIAVKDMAGLLKPSGAKVLFEALRAETKLPIHFHTHDTSGLSAATVLAAVDAGVDAVDAAMDALSGGTSQPCLGSIVEALSHHERAPDVDIEAIRSISLYWEQVRSQYAAFESDVKAPASEVYLHEMPGGQYTNLKEQARSLGLETRWSEVSHTYAAVNEMFGDIVKVTPSSKVVGDLALMMVSQDLTVAEVLDPDKEIAFPESVVSLMKGELSKPADGWPAALQAKVLKGEKPLEGRVGDVLPDADFEALRKEAEEAIGRDVSDQHLASYLMYPKVFVDYALAQQAYGPTWALPTPVYFYGMKAGDEIRVEIETGKLLLIRCLAMGEMDDQGMVTVFFELNGQPRRARVPDRIHGGQAAVARPKAEDGNPKQVGAPMPGVVSTIMVEAGSEVA